MFDSVEDAVAAIRRGEIVIVTDDESRENEGDFVMAADKATEESVNFMTKHGRGLLCVTMTAERLSGLGLSRMATKGRGSPFSTAFMESVDAARNVTTGISAHDRSEAIRVLADERSTPADLVTPGHIFPLEARPGGVLNRAGHTEASVDLAKLAGLRPCGVICEILAEDGKMARLPDLIPIKERHGLKMTSVADLIAYRRKAERLVEFVRRVDLATGHGPFVLNLYRSVVDGEHHVALVRGDVKGDAPVLVRVHSECLTGDVFGSRRCDCGRQLDAAMEMISKAGKGVLLYLREEGRGIGLANKIHAYELQQKKGLDTVEANLQLGFPADLRDYGVGAQILCDLGVKRLRLMTNNPRKIVALEGYGLEVVERVAVVFPPDEHSEKYLRTKKEKLGHLL
ncbi:MAG: bifunctional 3,4-dihydroxy-2-butanone-4-phosphate synthase/GTP cyclohydrolase II [Elusimicrobia bacterium]|nr:bifunctional 3,4-dihydroxy-2-butanone-4-phosphate synthase/GTP cyclohydrolase II [Elusimicrobiota bacterium]